MEKKQSSLKNRLHSYSLAAAVNKNSANAGELFSGAKFFTYSLAATAVFGGICDLQAQTSGTSGNTIGSGSSIMELGSNVKIRLSGGSLSRGGSNATEFAVVASQLYKFTPSRTISNNFSAAWGYKGIVKPSDFRTWEYIGIRFMSGGSFKYAWTSIRVVSSTVEFGNWAYSDGSITTPSDPAMPVELTSFTSTLKGLAAELQWNTATETNNYGFEIERSRGNALAHTNAPQQGAWEKIGFVDGHGTTSTPHSYAFTDPVPLLGKSFYRLKQIDRNGEFAYSPIVSIENTVVPAEFTLSQNFPNPFNPTTTINYDIPADCRVAIKVYDLLGAEVATLVDEYKTAGRHQRVFDASNLAAGTYVYTISAGAFTQSKRLVLLK